MRRPFVAAALAAAVLSAPAPAAEFPAVEQLPSRPNMPDPLVMLDGTPVATPADWTGKRRPELKSLFEHYMYGKAPAAPGRVTATVDRVDGKALGGKATLKEVTVTFGPPEAPKVRLLLVVPNARKGPAPAFLGLSFLPIHTVLDDPEIAMPAEPKDRKPAPRGAQVRVWNAEDVVDRGYALAVFASSDLAPDRPDRAAGVFPSYPGHDWGHIAAWAWGASRALDYLATDPDVDRARVAVVGHSRMGKAALLAGAFDERFALVFSHQAGCGGSAPSRGTVGESVERINTAFPHWFNDVFKQFNDQPDRLPFDQNDLVAMAAPRPVLFTAAVEDTWSNPEGQFQVLKAASPAYKLLGTGGLGAERMPEPGKLLASTLGYAIRPGKHAMTRDDWAFFLDFADTHLGKPR